MKRPARIALLLAAIAAILGSAAFATPTPVEAAPYCYTRHAPTADMQGSYLAPEWSARINVNNCGGIEVIWDNNTGRHAAYYVAVDRVTGGGFVAESDVASGGIFPDGSDVIAIKPAERGFIQLFTSDASGSITGVYRLYKA